MASMSLRGVWIALQRRAWLGAPAQPIAAES
jgi:hypothetical protein